MADFLPAGWPYNQTGSALGAATNPWLQQADWYQQYQQTPMGQQQTAQEEQARKYLQDQASQEYGLKVRQLDQQAQQMALTEGNQKASQWLQQEQLKLAQQAQQDQRFQFAQTFGETQLQNDRQFGLSALGLAQQTEKNPFKYVDVLEGLGPNSPLAQQSGFLQRMQAGTYQPVRGGGTGHPTLEGLASTIDGSTSGGSSMYPSESEMTTRRNNDLGMISTISQNPANYANVYKRLDPYQANYINQGVDYGGGDSQSFLSQMRRGAFGNRAA